MSSKAVEYTRDENLTITTDMDIFDISFNKDKNQLANMENYVKFVKGCEKSVRKHPDYNHFVSTVRDLNMPHCQVLGNITKFDAEVQMHHNVLTLFDYCAIVTDHLLAHDELVNTFKVAKLVLQEHFDEHVNIVMLCTTVHEMIDTGEIFINLSQGIGNINEFFKKYKDGLGRYAEKINQYIDLSKQYKSNDNRIFDLEENMVNWSYRSLPNSLKNRM